MQIIHIFLSEHMMNLPQGKRMFPLLKIFSSSIHMLNKYPERKYESELHIVCFIVVHGNDWLLLLRNIFNQLYILKMGISFQRNEEKLINKV